jgi:hypothetical protein
MASPRRSLSTQNKELKPWVRIRATALATILMVGGLIVLAYGRTLAGPPRPPLRVPALDIAEWLHIAGELEERVPARFLLGASGPNRDLDAALEARGLKRADFQRAAAIVAKSVSDSTEAAAAEALATAFSNFPLPEDVEIPEALRSLSVDRSPEMEEARRLVLTLTARLEASDSETENT